MTVILGMMDPIALLTSNTVAIPVGILKALEVVLGLAYVFFISRLNVKILVKQLDNSDMF